MFNADMQPICKNFHSIFTDTWRFTETEITNAGKNFTLTTQKERALFVNYIFNINFVRDGDFCTVYYY